MVVTWKLPKDADFDHVVLVRSTARSLQAQKVVYTGRGTTYTDRRLSNDVAFRYTLQTVDAAGNRSDGVSATATPHTIYLVKPADGARISASPTLVWVPLGKLASGTYVLTLVDEEGNKPVLSRRVVIPVK